MKTNIVVMCLIGFGLASISNDDSMDNGINRRADFSSENQHKNSCLFHASLERSACRHRVVSQKYLDKTTREAKLKLCDKIFREKVGSCNPRNLENTSVTPELDKCQENATRSYDLCIDKINGLGPKETELAEGICWDNASLDFEKCNSGKGTRLMKSNNHKSWCTFKASSAKVWCKVKGVSLNKIQFALNMANCDDQYNLKVSQCAQNRLLKQLENSIISGQGHKAVSDIMKKLKWVECKTRAAFNLDVSKRTTGLAQCDSALVNAN